MILPELPPTPPSSTMPEHMVVSATFALAREALAWEHAHTPGCLDPLSAEDDTLAVMAVELLATLPLDASAWRGRKGVGLVWFGWRETCGKVEVCVCGARHPCAPWCAPLPLARRVWGLLTSARTVASLEARAELREGSVCVCDAELDALERWGRDAVRAVVREREALELHTLHSVRIGAPWGWGDGQLCQPSVPSLALG